MILNASRMFGMSMVMMPVSTNGLNQLPARFYPHGTAMKAMLEGINDAFFGELLISIVALLLDFFIKQSKQAEDPGGSIPIEKKNAKTEGA